jgi:hypothetical protein
MPPRGVKSSKRARQYEHIKESAKKQGRSTARAKQIAAATVNKQRRQAGETKSSGGSRKSSSKKSGAKKSAAKKSSTRSRTASGSGTRKSGAKKR